MRINVMAGAFVWLLVVQYMAIAEAKEFSIKSSKEKTTFTLTPSSGDKPFAKPLQTAQLPPPEVNRSNPSVLVPNPDITITQSGAGPSISPPTISEPSILPRAVAPPVGDMSISNVDASQPTVDLGPSGSNQRIPRAVFKDATVREVLFALGSYVNMSVVFVRPPTIGGGAIQAAVSEDPTQTKISLSVENQPVQDVFNSVLLAAGLRAGRKSNTIYVGTVLPDAARDLVSRTIRLNQVTSERVAILLAAQGAESQRLIVPVKEVRDPETNRIVERIEESPELRPLVTKQEPSSTSPNVLRGLRVTADERLNMVTLVGEPRLVQIATSYITQLDARRRQVAVNVKIIDVNLNNIDSSSSSFSFGFDDGFFVQDKGSAILNFGKINPPDTTLVNTFFPPVVTIESTIPNPSGGAIDFIPFLDQQDGPFGDVTVGDNTFNVAPQYARPSFGSFSNPFQPGLREITRQDDGIVYNFQPPTLYQYPNKFLLSLQAQIQNNNAKILTDPTLVVQEGQVAAVKLVQQVVTSVKTDIDPLSGTRTITPVVEDAGLTLTVDIKQIDDNGFITFIVNPRVSAVGSTQTFDSGGGARNELRLLNTRELNSNLIRLRDGQTLIVSGIIQETDRTITSKVPVLGDLPILGALFRSNENTVDRREVIIVITPQVLDESTGFSYNYRPGQDAAEVIRKQGIAPPNP